jgi:hypothetical protein
MSELRHFGFAMNHTLEKIRNISNRLARALAILVVLFIPGALYAYHHPGNVIISAPMACFAVGVIGGFVGLQRRLKKMTADDLTLLANSWVYVCLAPLVGGILAVLTYVLFVSGLLAGDLFPKFVPDADAAEHHGLSAIFAIHGGAPDYGKMLFWCFVAGFSERFATDIISRFEIQAANEGETGPAENAGPSSPETGKRGDAALKP